MMTEFFNPLHKFPRCCHAHAQLKTLFPFSLRIFFFYFKDFYKLILSTTFTQILQSGPICFASHLCYGWITHASIKDSNILSHTQRYHSGNSPVFCLYQLFILYRIIIMYNVLSHYNLSHLKNSGLTLLSPPPDCSFSLPLQKNILEKLSTLIAPFSLISLSLKPMQIWSLLLIDHFVHLLPLLLSSCQWPIFL